MPHFSNNSSKNQLTTINKHQTHQQEEGHPPHHPPRTNNVRLVDEHTVLLHGGEEEEEEDNDNDIDDSKCTVATTTAVATNPKKRQPWWWYSKKNGSIWLVLLAAGLGIAIVLYYYGSNTMKQNNTMGNTNHQTNSDGVNTNNINIQGQNNLCTTVGVLSQEHRQEHPHYTFPENFVWGAATSSFQIEGGIKERGLTIWDEFCRRRDNTHHILDHSNANVACDHYHRVRQDVQLLASLNIRAYRFSMAWSRILPHGTLRVRANSNSNNNTTTTTNNSSSNSTISGINQAGIDFYNNLIDTLLEFNIEPWLTLFHWDLPLALYENNSNGDGSSNRSRGGGGGWLNERTIAAFAEDYARLCFAAFGDRVKRWITFNEAWTVAVNGHGTGVHAPGHQSATEPYIVGHHILLAHVRAVQIYKTEFQQQHHGGMIGMSNCGDFRYPKTAVKSDVEAAQRAMEFQFAWFVDPLLSGPHGHDYPAVMRERIGNDRLPIFTKQQREMLQTWGPQTDFIGLNYYSSLLAAEPTEPENYQGYWADMHVNFSRLDSNNDNDDIDWTVNDMNWPIVPDGLRELLLWIAKRYNNPLVFITENGSAEKDVLVDKPQDVQDGNGGGGHDQQQQQQQYYIHDEKRRVYFEAHLRACATAISTPAVADDETTLQQETDGAKPTPPALRLGGYFAWSLMDNFEWQFGYQRRFGLCHVDFESSSLQRTPKRSAYWYKTTIQNHGRNIPYQQPKSWFPTAMAFNPTPSNARQRQRQRQQQALITNNEVIEKDDDSKKGEVQQEIRQRLAPPRERLPKRLLIGYGSDVEKVRTAVYAGVNVVIWSFMEIKALADETNCDDDDDDDDDTNSNVETMMTRAAVDKQTTGLTERRQQEEHHCRKKKTSISTNLDLPAIQKLMAELDQEGYHHVVHLVSFGGWNGPHLDPNLTASEWWHDGFKEHVGHVFDGLDWDLEGHDDLNSPTNCFTHQTLRCMGEISRLAKQDGYWIGMAPPQSYLDMVTDYDDDVETGHRFSRYVNLTDPIRPWHSHFSYYGGNVYAYLLAKYGDYMDFISIQFYESYSRAADATFRNGLTPAAYLKHYLTVLSQQNDSFLVNFGSNHPDLILDNDDTNTSNSKRDDTTARAAAMSPTLVSVPRSKLVLGLANGWALNPDLKDTGKVFFLRPDDELRQLWKSLEEKEQEDNMLNRLLPRGFMFWTVNEEGQNQVSLASSLADIIFKDNNGRDDYDDYEYCYNEKDDCDEEDGAGDVR